MERKNLRCYKEFCIEIEDIRERIFALESQIMSAKSARVDGSPKSASYTNRQESLIAAYIDLKEVYISKLETAAHEKKRIEYAISSLPSLQKTVLRKRYIDGKTIRQTAEELSYSPEQIKRITKRAINALRDI